MKKNKYLFTTIISLLIGFSAGYLMCSRLGTRISNGDLETLVKDNDERRQLIATSYLMGLSVYNKRSGILNMKNRELRNDEKVDSVKLAADESLLTIEDFLHVFAELKYLNEDDS